MNMFSSLLVARDSASLEALSGLGIHVGATASLDGLFAALSKLKGARCAWAKIATYRMTEKVLDLPVGRFLREAARESDLEIVFDWCSHRAYGGVTRALVDDLPLTAEDGVVRDLKYAGTATGLFHPKVMLMGLDLAAGEQLWLAVVGSANMTAGAFRTNTELGVLFAERGPRSADHVLCGWPEVKALFDAWAVAATPMSEADLEDLPDDDDEIQEWTENGVPAALRLRPYQREAVGAIVRAWESRYTKRPRASWKGTLLVLPPATGKTLCALAAACKILEQEDATDPVVWLSDRPLLAAQAFEEFHRTGFLQRHVTGVLAQAGRIRRTTASDDLSVDADSSLSAWLARPLQAGRTIIFTTKGDSRTLRALASAPPGLTIVDEAHHATAQGWNDALVDLRSYLVLGLTGTPYRKSPESHETARLLAKFSVGDERWLTCFMPDRRARVLSVTEDANAWRIAYGRPVESFYRNEFTGTDKAVLSAPTFDAVSVVGPLGNRVVVRPKGSQSQRIRFFESPFSDERDLEDVVHDASVVEAALDAIDLDATDRAERASVARQTILMFARNIAHATRLQRLLEGRGVPVVTLHSEDGQTIGERHRALKQVREEAGSVLVCVDMLAEGLDMPTADLVVMTRWTSSERLFWQMIGRGLRGPDVGGTERVEIVTYDLQFGDAPEGDGDPGVQRVDDFVLEAFGQHARHRQSRLKLGPPRRPPHRRGADEAQGFVQRRQGFMRLADIRHRESLGLGGSVFDVVVTVADGGTIADEREGVRHPWRVLRNLYESGRRGRKYRFVVTGRGR